MPFGKTNTAVRNYMINPEIKTVEQVVKFLAMMNISYNASITLPPEMQELLRDGIIIEKIKTEQ